MKPFSGTLADFSEATLLKAVMLRFSNGCTRLFRNNVGVTRFPDGSTVAYGLCKGSSDLIGWRSVTITQEMVERKVAVFTAVETKSKRGRAEEAQLNFLAQVNAAGGIGVLAKQPAHVEEAFQRWEAGQ